MSETSHQKYVLVGYCGLYCGACYHYLASLPGHDYLVEQFGHDQAKGGFTCLGCRSDKLYIHPGCRECKLRACAQSRGILHCGQCPEFPCDRLIDFENDGRAHHRSVTSNLRQLRSQGMNRWLKIQKNQWACECGARLSWYEEICTRCSAQLPRRFEKTKSS